MTTPIKRPFLAVHAMIALIGVGLYSCAGCQQSAQDMTQLKQELKQEILAELRQENELSAQTLVASTPKDIPEQAREAMKAEIAREVLAKMQSQTKNNDQVMRDAARDSETQSAQRQPSSTGSAQGYIRQNGRGFQGCQVKLVRVLTTHSATEMFSAVREGTEFTAITDGQGKYAFDRLPVGSYKLKWQLPGDKGWIRRLRDKPDAIVTEGQATILKSVETKRRLVGR